MAPVKRSEGQDTSMARLLSVADTMVFGHMDGKSHCKIMDDWFGVFVQGILAALAISLLMAKWSLETPRRKLKIFFLDSSKQIVGGTIVHIINMAIVFTLFWNQHRPKLCDECDYYALLSIIFNTVGTAIEFALLRASEYYFGYTSGKYDSKEHRMDWDNNPDYSKWCRQLAGWVCIIMAMKTIVLTTIALVGSPPFERMGSGITGGIKDPKEKLMVAMILVPLVGNIFQFLVTDSFLRYQQKYFLVPPDEENLESDRTHYGVLRSPLMRSPTARASGRSRATSNPRDYSRRETPPPLVLMPAVKSPRKM